MRKATPWVTSLLFLTASALAAAPCNPSPTTLCLNSSRFQVDVSWRDSRDRTGVGQAVPITADTGYFWFFSQANIELVVKVLDARSVNGKYWVFFGALSSVQYDLKVTDTTNGASKTYHNPLGRFASVGDTQAFSPAAPVTSNEVVDVEGTLAPPDSMDSVQRFVDVATSLESIEAPAESAAFTPCADEGSSLFLAGCRFRLNVHWADSHGRHGSGHPVQLTNDTGYFWFFSDANVELMVKVLDARPVNGKFWVFFGALSNVEYAIDVIDTASGAIRSYSNVQGTFASVGDTSAFRGGYGVSLQEDTAYSVSGLITAAGGGSLSASAADGTVFTLQVPPEAVFQDQAITMTPVRASGTFPFAGGLSAGVNLEPAGLVLLGGATLSIHTPTPIARSQETPVAWNGAGEDFYLFPPDAGGGDLVLYILHFGGYGVARGNDAERATQIGREPIGDADLLAHRISPLLRAGRVAAQGASGFTLKAATDLERELIVAFDAWYQEKRQAMLETDGEPLVVIRLVEDVLDWRSRLENALKEPLDSVFVGRSSDMRLLFNRMFRLALGKIHARCSDDPLSAAVLQPIVTLMHREGVDVDLQSDVDIAVRCLTFKLKFESTITTGQFVGGKTVQITHKAFAEITLRTPHWPALTAGNGTIDFTIQSIDGLPGECSHQAVHGPGTFSALLVFTNLFGDGGAVKLDKLHYNIGTPYSDFIVTCKGITVHVRDLWFSMYYLLHDIEGIPEYPFIQGNWSMKAGKDPWATAQAPKPPRELPGVTETTKFTLIHTPE
jgi:hypothetical protein